MALVCLLVGVILMLVGGIWVLVEAFKESILWGLGSLFVPLVGLVFVIMHWQVAKKPFLIQLAGIPFYVLGIFLAPEGEGGW